MPRDFDGRMLLNENPVCVELHAPDNLLSGGRSISSAFRRTMKIYLRHVPSVLRLSELGTAVSGGSAVLETKKLAS